MYVHVQTVFPRALYELDRQSAVVLMLEHLREVYADYAQRIVTLDPVLCRAALADLQQQIDGLEQVYRSLPQASACRDHD